MNLSRSLFLCGLSLALAGCSTIFKDAVTPPDDASFSQTYTGTGYLQFQCTVDKHGYYWRFIAPEIEIRDASGQLFAKQVADFTFLAADGSSLKSKISSSQESSSRVRDVLFETTPRGTQNGVLSHIRWVKRTEAHGGVPPDKCNRRTLGNFVREPFSAKFSFYR